MPSSADPPAAPAATLPLLDARGVERRFGATRVLRGVDLAVAHGEAVAIVGPNGAGKSTLLRCLAGLMRPTSGHVHVLGRRLDAGDPEARRPLGLVSHQSLLYDDLTVRENLRLAARLYGLADERGAVERALAAAGIAHRADESPRRLSRGLLQRAAIARAIVHEPTLLLLDEPFTGLDAPGAERFRRLLAEQRAAGRALVLVTHQLVEAWELCTRVAVLQAGTWAVEEPRAGDVDDFLRRYHALLEV